MKTTLSASRWICLLTLAVVMLFSASEAVDSGPLGLPCYSVNYTRKINVIKHCYEQKRRRGCEQHVFLVKNRWGTWTISANAKWLTNKIKKGKLHCRSIWKITRVQDVDVV